MDLNKFEKIEGREALRRLLDGENIYVDESTFVHLPIYNDLQRVDIVNGKPKSEDDWISITEFVEHEWFIKKPFDVRQAMRDKPDEWVGAFKHQGLWHKIGFNLNQMEVVVSTLKSSALVKDCSRNYFNSVDTSFLDSSIDLNDVPLEAVL